MVTEVHVTRVDRPHHVAQEPDDRGTRPRRLPSGWTPASRRRIVEERRLAAENAQEAQKRLDAAAAELGQDSAGVRIAAVNTLALFAAEDPARRQACIDVLCAALRKTPVPRPGNDDRDQAGEQWLSWSGDRVCRQVILTVIAEHLNSDAAISWRGHDFDFSGVIFESGDLLAEAIDRVPGVARTEPDRAEASFAGAQFTGGKVSFAGAQFTGARLSFAGAQFTGGEVSFAEAQFTGGEVSYAGAHFTGGEVRFAGANFTCGEVSFGGARFSS
jgi:uncharacterized protein YjbI with pentapeptide repeats